MRLLTFLVLLSPLVILTAGPAFGAAGDKPKKIVAPPVPAVELRGPLDAPVAPPLQRLTQAVTLPPPGSSLMGLASAGFSAPPAISPLRSVGDPAPICRATCAEVRTTCSTTDDAGCDSRWIQCVATCSAPVER